MCSSEGVTTPPHHPDASTIPAEDTHGLGEFVLDHPPGTFALTPASRISIGAICDHQDLLRGRGIDWGCGVGVLAIVAARIPAVEEVLGLDISVANVRLSFENALRNGVSAKATFWKSDSFAPTSAGGRVKLDALVGHAQFVLANPPSSEGDDGFDFRRRVLRGATRFLADGGVVFLSISAQYGGRRIARLTEEVPGYRHEGVLSSTDWVPFDLKRPDLLRCVEAYAAEERRGGDAYEFVDPEHPHEGSTMNAQAALGCFRRTGLSPLSKWQTHLFRFAHAAAGHVNAA